MATTFSDPQHGVVRCPAAPLLVAALSSEPAVAGMKTRVRLGPAPPPAGPGDHHRSPAVDGVMFAASYANGAGTIAGLAVIAHRDDSAGMALAEQTALRWTQVVRSRRLLIADIPLCPGGRHAGRVMEDALRSGHGQVFTVGRPVTDRATRRNLERAGLTCTDALEKAPEEGQVIFPAHGVAPAVRAAAAARRLRVVDATCPLVAAAHDDAAAYAARGDHVVVIGRVGHAALPVLAAQAAAAAIVVHSSTDVAALGGLDPDRVSFVVDPAMPIEEVMPIIGALRRRYQNLQGHHFAALCDHGSDRAQTIASITTTSELMLIVTGVHGDANADANADANPDAEPDAEPDVHIALRAARGTGTHVRTVTRLADLDADILTNVTAIGMATTPTAPPGLESEITRALSGLGPVSMRRRGLHTVAINAEIELPAMATSTQHRAAHEGC